MEYNQHFLERATEKEGVSIFYFMYSSASGKWGANNNLSAELFYRALNRPRTGLYTGQKKEYIDSNGNIIESEDINNFKELDIIFATKSFGMGINLEECNYVGFIQPPSSLEDLYQQAGRAGRAGQDSEIDIYYAQYHLGNPLAKDSPFAFFLKMESERYEAQPWITKKLISEIIISDQLLIKISMQGLFKEMLDEGFWRNKNNTLKSLWQVPEFSNYVKWSIAHLINEFNLIDFYSIDYSGMKVKNNSNLSK